MHHPVLVSQSGHCTGWSHVVVARRDRQVGHGGLCYCDRTVVESGCACAVVCLRVGRGHAPDRGIPSWPDGVPSRVKMDGPGPRMDDVLDVTCRTACRVMRARDALVNVGSHPHLVHCYM